MTPSALRFLAETLASVDPVADREICSAVVRRLLAAPRRSKDAAFVRSLKKLTQRADPLLRGDMPALRSRSGPNSEIQIPSLPPGPLTPFDVVPLSTGRTLVALGELGVRVLSRDGRTHYGMLRSDLWAKSFDGLSWASVDQRGIVFYDMLAESPTVTWRELEPGWSCHAIERSDDSLAALVTAPPSAMYPEQRTMLWQWDLPAMRLRRRGRFAPVDGATVVRLTADAGSIWNVRAWRLSGWTSQGHPSWRRFRKAQLCERADTSWAFRASTPR